MARASGAARTGGPLLGLLSGVILSVPVFAAGLVAPVPFTDHRNPPSHTALPGQTADRYELGHAVFNTAFLPAGTPGAGRRAGVGPLFNGASCDECHNEGAHGRGPAGDGPAPDSLVLQLQAAAGAGGTIDPADPPAKPLADPPGDPVYGRVFNTVAVPGFQPEGEVRITYHVIERAYPDGSLWVRREPKYEFTGLKYGPLAPHTLVKPRIAPALFGAGLLAAAQVAGGPAGRFGWQSTALSIRDQTTRAFSREMGLSTRDRPADDCTPAETDCTGQTASASPEVSDELLEAVLTFQQWLAVPQSPTLAMPGSVGEQLFASTGCAGCHQPRLPVKLPPGTDAVIAPYTDLQLHDLGAGLADRDVSGVMHASRWRTAPLWGLGYRLGRESAPTFLHDGRARSPEEAVLWHDGEAAAVRKRFEHLSRAEREALLAFLRTL